MSVKPRVSCLILGYGLTSPSCLPPRIFVTTVSPSSIRAPDLSVTWSDSLFEWFGQSDLAYVSGAKYDRQSRELLIENSVMSRLRPSHDQGQAWHIIGHSGRIQRQISGFLVAMIRLYEYFSLLFSLSVVHPFLCKPFPLAKNDVTVEMNANAADAPKDHLSP